jgi:hypothetical protein
MRGLPTLFSIIRVTHRRVRDPSPSSLPQDDSAINQSVITTTAVIPRQPEDAEGSLNRSRRHASTSVGDQDGWRPGSRGRAR